MHNSCQINLYAVNVSYFHIAHCRGKRSLETICLTLAYKIKYPENVFLLRGNHECASINRLVWLNRLIILVVTFYVWL